MKKRAAAAVLTGILALQPAMGAVSVQAAAEMQITVEQGSQAEEGFVQPEEELSVMPEEESAPEEDLLIAEEESDLQEVLPGDETRPEEAGEETAEFVTEDEADAFFTDGSDEIGDDAGYADLEIEQEEMQSVYAAGVLYAEEIDWENEDDSYWEAMDWSAVDWSHMWNDKDVEENSWAWEFLGQEYYKWSMVDFGKVDWGKVNWKTIDWATLDDPEKPAWEEINWAQVDWSTVDWSSVRWSKIKELAQANKVIIDYSFPTVHEGSISAEISMVGYGYAGENQSWYSYYMIEGENLSLSIGGVTVPANRYVVLLARTGGNTGEYVLKGVAGGWRSVDESTACTSFFEGDMNLPKIADPENDPQNKYWNIADYYTLEGLPESICYLDSEPQLLVSSFSARKNYNSIEAIEKKGKEDGKHYLYLQEKEDSWYSALPKIDSDDNEALWAGNVCLKTEYSYDGGNVWNGSFSWEDWLRNGEPAQVQVKVSVVTQSKYTSGNTTDKYWWDRNTGVPRYLEGEITGSFSVNPYSLDESDSEHYPSTKPNYGGWLRDFVLVNPLVTEDTETYKPYTVTKRVEKDKPIDDVTYNGEAQTPKFDMGIYRYYDNDLIGGFIQYYDAYHPYSIDLDSISEDDPIIKSIAYSNNVNAGQASVTVTFQGRYSGSITRNFQILPKQMQPSYLNVKIVKNPSYTGAVVLPDIVVTDTETGEVLKEGTDYQFVTSGAGNRVNAGAATVTIQGKGNYSGSLSVSYEILQADTPSTPTPGPSRPVQTVTPQQIKANTVSINKKLKTVWKGSSIKVTWGKVSQADGYDIFVQKCGKQFNSKSLVKSVKGASVTSATISKAAGKKLNTSGNYKVRVKAYSMVNGKKKYIGNSLILHIAGKKSSKYTNTEKIKVTKTSYTLKKGKTAKISAKVVKQSSSKKLLPTSHTARLRYWSTNTAIATVTSNGKVKAKAKGTCYIYVVAADGVYKAVKIKVK